MPRRRTDLLAHAVARISLKPSRQSRARDQIPGITHALKRRRNQLPISAGLLHDPPGKRFSFQWQGLCHPFKPVEHRLIARTDTADSRQIAPAHRGMLRIEQLHKFAKIVEYPAHASPSAPRAARLRSM